MGSPRPRPAARKLIRVTLWAYCVVFVAAFIGGAVNSVSGGGTLITFPALIWTGMNPVVANATNTVALWPGSLASLIGFRREFSAVSRRSLMLAVPSLVGGIVGAYLLINTPTDWFAAAVPYLILGATILFAAQEVITRAALRNSMDEIIDAAGGDPIDRGGWGTAFFFQFLVSIYGGYFGAGIGILMLAEFGLLGFTDIHHMLALRNYLALCINGVAAIYFVLRGAVSWPQAILMTVAQVCGGYGGALIARRLSRRMVRWIVVGIGLSMAASLFIAHK
ncbi:MAG: sulfite exporter TauE/SafE family protein [Candidatus Binatus sp.]|jgi:uncharacterized membrane protein YfcA